MVSDYQGNVSNFVLVVPVPTVLQKDRVRTISPEIVQRLDAYSAPRLVARTVTKEHHDAVEGRYLRPMRDPNAINELELAERRRVVL